MDDTPESTYHTGEENIPRHARYYLEDGNVTFLVGNTLFQVHRYQFQDSPYFHAVEANRDADTDSSYIYVAPEERAIELRDIKHFDFEALLEILYTPIFVEYPYPISTSKWSAILRMAHLWQFYDLKNFSFQRLELLPIHPVDKIVLYRECGLSHMLRAAYAELCARDQPISLNEGLLLGMETVTNIFKIRESVFRQQWSFRTEISPEELEHWRDALILDLFPSVAAGPPVPVGKIVDTTPRMNGLQLDVSSPVTLTSKVPEVATPERPKGTRPDSHRQANS
ncbi:hypothetical protein BOTBODRAFT_439314 [Botryobasidium botryosum FD-172 SS1]|uniref:BTB domain-containing protein n=1 Tax=Botryobasidium botryosum (strain FD-172 SS1) TaxID=930990 RepID=A0A067MUL7_BOTB1|nr:hypothetical protein BOTBODRAFT_439314 [Botryobasidium botryosum FD-172 SS1]